MHPHKTTNISSLKHIRLSICQLKFWFLNSVSSRNTKYCEATPWWLECIPERHARRSKLRASVNNDEQVGEVTYPLPTSHHFFLTQGALLRSPACSPACSISSPGQEKENLCYAGCESISGFMALGTFTPWLSVRMSLWSEICSVIPIVSNSYWAFLSSLRLSC